MSASGEGRCGIQSISGAAQHIVTLAPNEQVDPKVSGNRVVWRDQREEEIHGMTDFDVWMAESDLFPAAPSGLTLNGAGSAVTLSWQTHMEPDVTEYNIYRLDIENISQLQVNRNYTTPLYR